jgi:hypothetical protein
MTTDNPDAKPAAQGPADAAGGQPTQIRLELDAANVATSYANMCAVTPMPLEVIMDFVLMTGPPERQRGPIKINSRVVLNYYSAKQLMLALRRAVERHEAMYGTLELDPRKRLTPSAREMLVQQSSPPTGGQAGPDDADKSDGDDDEGKVLH